MLSTFWCACWLSVCLLWENVFSDLLLIFNQIVVFCFFFFCCTVVWVLYIFWILTYQIYDFAEGSFLILLMVFLALQIYLVWCSFTCFCYLTKKLSPRQMTRSLPPMLSSGSFMVSYLMFKSSIHLKWGLCMVLDSGPVSFFCAAQFTQTITWKDCCISLASLL